MKKTNKLNLFIFAFFAALFSVVFLNTQSIVNNDAFAAENASYSFVVSNSTTNNTKTIALSFIESDNSQIILSTSATDFNKVFDLILNTLTSNSLNFENASVSICFDNFISINSETITIPNGNFVFSGQLTHPFNTAAFKTSAEAINTISFVDFIISSSSEKIILVENATNLNLTIKNSSFESNIENSYAIYFNSSVCNLTLSETNNHISTYFFNYIKTLNILFDNFSQEFGSIKISLPSNLNKEPVLNNITATERQAFDFCAENQTYSIEVQPYWTSKKILCSSKINLSANLNGGTANEQLTTGFIYGNLYQIPSAIIKSENYFRGWFGSVTLDQKIYYFDTNMLEDAKKTNFNIETLSTIFSQDLESVSNDYAISKFFDETDSQNISFSNNFIELYKSLNQIPVITAKWEYEISFDTTNGDPLQPVCFSIDAKNTNIPTPIKKGHTFDGWFLSQNFETTCDFAQIKTNTTVYAKWLINSYQITYHQDIGSEIIENLTFAFGSNISFPSFEKTGHSLAGWALLDGTVFDSKTMPASNVEIVAVWQKKTYVTYFETDGNEYISPIWSKYKDSISKPITPTKTGYTFNKWIDKDTNLEFDFSTTPAKESRTAVATWTANQYTATFMFSNIGNKKVIFGEPITTIPIRPGFKFLGWYGENGTKVDTMPASDVVLYPSWQEKLIVDITLNSQTDFVDSQKLGYDVSSNISNFVVEYLVDGNWTTQTPLEKGIYDVKISRAEDENYAAFSEVLSGGYEILPKHIDLKIAIIIMFALFFVEICLVIVIKWLIKQKQNTPRLFAVILPFAMFETNEFITAIIAIISVIAAFVWLVHDIVILHKTSMTESSEKNYDNRSTINKIEDKSNDIEIEQKVEDILVKNNLIKPSNKQKTIKINNDDNEDIDYLSIFDDNNK